jgi:hypothetical protein
MAAQHTTSGPAFQYKPRDLAKVLRRMAGRELMRAQENGMKRGLRRARKIALGELPRRGVLRRIFQKKPKGLGVLITLHRVRFHGTSVIGALQLKGLAAIQEVGGRTKPHVIKPSLKKALRFEGSSGTHFQRVGVRHPGSKMPAIPVLPGVMAEAAPVIMKEIERGVLDRFRKHGF